MCIKSKPNRLWCGTHFQSYMSKYEWQIHERAGANSGVNLIQTPTYIAHSIYHKEQKGFGFLSFHIVLYWFTKRPWVHFTYEMCSITEVIIINDPTNQPTILLSISKFRSQRTNRSILKHCYSLTNVMKLHSVIRFYSYTNRFYICIL